jgi:hypothetical protein
MELFSLKAGYSFSSTKGEQAFGRLPGPALFGKADGMRVVLLAVVQESAGADGLLVDRQDGDARGVAAEMERAPGGAGPGPMMMTSKWSDFIIASPPSWR